MEQSRDSPDDDEVPNRSDDRRRPYPPTRSRSARETLRARPIIYSRRVARVTRVTPAHLKRDRSQGGSPSNRAASRTAGTDIMTSTRGKIAHEIAGLRSSIDDNGRQCGHVGEVHQAHRLTTAKVCRWERFYNDSRGVSAAFPPDAFPRCQIAAILQATLLPSGVRSHEIMDCYTRSQILIIRRNVVQPSRYIRILFLYLI